MTAFARTDRTLLGRWWWTVDRFALGAVVLLAFLGVLMVFAASPPVARKLDLPEMHFIAKHLKTLFLALVCLFAFSTLAPRGVLRLAIACFVVFAGLTLATLVWAPEIKGAHRWLFPLGQQLQPSEFLKPSLAVVVAWLLARKPGLEGLPLAALITAATVAALLFQPDLGMAALISAIFCAQLFVAGLTWRWVAMAVGAGVAGLWAAYQSFDHVRDRIDTFLEPASAVDQAGIAMRAVSSGGLFGRGPGEGVVKFSLPEAHSDFVFVTAAEEFGILFCLLIVVVFAVLVLRTLHRIRQSEDRFVALAATGLVTQLGLQAVINMAVNLNLMPTKGMTLPLISYGGSSMVAIGLGLGMLLALTRRSVRLGAVT